jgi:predicted DNA-binding transcriptional regulator AlpA
MATETDDEANRPAPATAATGSPMNRSQRQKMRVANLLAEPEALPAADAARLLGISRSLFFKMHSAGKVPMPAYLTERCPRWLRTELLDWLSAGCPDRLTWTKLRKGKR